ncbi:hypothetical protein [Aequorivita xiaoshiensis]|uniref:Uncharacterized protein n=1 Tax=Aequorivita xiaoshiensis TaxID=2874476 RepID=A0A9X1U7F8_9FLAO|nr:hypothetical protein [Aequorivita xiaoshiensis]MCG2432162.1 hypothetical protein [Aequorivita xiaoshiensis]
MTKSLISLILTCLGWYVFYNNAMIWPKITPIALATSMLEMDGNGNFFVGLIVLLLCAILTIILALLVLFLMIYAFVGIIYTPILFFSKPGYGISNNNIKYTSRGNYTGSSTFNNENSNPKSVKNNNSYSKESDSNKDFNSVVGGIRGTSTYKGDNWFTEKKVGRTDNDGNTYSGNNWFTEKRTGRVSSDGDVYDGGNWFTEKKTGSIKKDGNIYEGNNWFTEKKTGRIDKDGNIYEGSNWFTEKKVGKHKK